MPCKLQLQYTITMLLEEMASIFITPYLLIFVVPKVMYFKFLYQKTHVFLNYVLKCWVFNHFVACWWYSTLHIRLHSLRWWSGRCVQVCLFLLQLIINYQSVTSAASNDIAVWHLNSLSMFDLRRHGNRNYGSPHNAVKSMRSSQGKMEKSLLRYPYLILNMSLIIYIYLKHISIITIVLVLLCAYMLCTSYHGPLF